jgi:phosphatidylserine/phosphatidylglycerophosphate/cardiolipin synthase-like enzyme
VNSGIPTQIDSRHAIAHNKVMIIDGETVIPGSFNFTKAAEEKNAENLLIIRDKALARRYLDNWQEHAGHSESHSGKWRATIIVFLSLSNDNNIKSTFMVQNGKQRASDS